MISLDIFYATMSILILVLSKCCSLFMTGNCNKSVAVIVWIKIIVEGLCLEDGWGEGVGFLQDFVLPILPS